MTKIFHNGLELFTQEVHSTIWHCTDENYDGADDGGPNCGGIGTTEQEAIDDYKDEAQHFYSTNEESTK